MCNVKISIIIPVYNVAPYLHDCLDSVLIGQGENYEVIAVDDCSSDDSLTILREYENRYTNLKVVNFTENRGVSAARNVGLDRASGEWLMFCDSDDAFIPGAIPLLCERIHSIECDMVIFELQRVYAASDEVERKANYVQRLNNMCDEDDAVSLIRENFPHRLWAWNKCFKRSLIGSLRFRNYQPCEDAVFSLDCMVRAKHILEMPEILYKYVQHEGSCLKTINAKRINGDINGMVDLCETALNWRYARTIKQHVYRLLRDCFFRGCIRNLRNLELKSPNEVATLEKSFFDGVEKVFVKSSLVNPLKKMGYWFIAHFGSLAFAEICCRCVDWMRVVLSLPKRFMRQIF